MQQTVKCEEHDSSSDRADCLFHSFNSLSDSCISNSNILTEFMGYPKERILGCYPKEENPSYIDEETSSPETKIITAKVYSIKQDGGAVGDNKFTPEVTKLTPGDSEVVIPVNLMRLLQGAEADDDIARYLTSTKSRNKTERDLPVKTPKRLHPAHAGVRCEVCGGKAVGFHYGADVCTGCRLFFYRHHKKSPLHSCGTNSKRACTACRLERCVNSGMSVKACKRGRYSYETMYKYSVKTSPSDPEGVGLPRVRVVPSRRQNSALPRGASARIPRDLSPADDEIIVVSSRISEAFISYTSYPPNYFENIKKGFHPEYTAKPSTECAIGSQEDKCDFDRMHLDRYTQAGLCMQNLHRFIEQLPGYNKMPQQDRWAFFIRHMLPVHIISEYRAYDVEKGIEFHLKGTVTTRQDMQQHIGSEYTDQLFQVVEKLQKLSLDENERNLLKLAGFFESDSEITEKGQSVTSREQDVMIRAFDHVVRVNRNNSFQATVVIGAAMQILSDIHVLLEVSGKDVGRNMHRYPDEIKLWVQQTFQGNF